MECFGIATFWYHDIKLVFCEADELVEGLFVGTIVEGVQGIEDFFAEFEEHSGKHLLVNHSGVFHPVGHDVVDVLDEDEVGTLLVEVLNECTVSARAEDEASVFVANGIVLLVDGDDVGVMFLFREGYFQFDTEGGFVVLFDFGYFLAEARTVFRRDGKVQVDSVVGVASVECTFNDVLLEGCALYFAVAVEFEERFG